MRRAVLLLLLFLAPVAVFAGMVAVDRIYGAPGRGWDYVVTVLLPSTENGGNLPEILGPADASRPLVVIDAGHGGKDPGAGAGEIKEKQLTLALALALRDELEGIFATRTQQAWTEAFEKADCCVSPVLSTDEAIRHPQFISRSLAITDTHSTEGEYVKTRASVLFRH